MIKIIIVIIIIIIMIIMIIKTIVIVIITMMLGESFQLQLRMNIRNIKRMPTNAPSRPKWPVQACCHAGRTSTDFRHVLR